MCLQGSGGRYDESDAGSIFSEEEGKRRARAQHCSWLTAQLPGYEDAGNLREKAHLQRMVTSADRLFPVRNSLKTLGIEKLNAIVYRRPDPSGLMSTLSADIYTGLWSCCRKTNASAPGCVLGTHSDTTFLCTRCGVTFDNSTTTPAQRECFYHPGAINRSKAGGATNEPCIGPQPLLELEQVHRGELDCFATALEAVECPLLYFPDNQGVIDGWRERRWPARGAGMCRLRRDT